MTLDPITATLLQDGPYQRSDAPFRLLEVRGPDAGDYLQRLCSADVLTLEPGATAKAAFLDGKGKLLVTCLVQRDGESFWLETATEQHERLVELLDRYHFSEKLAFVVPDGFACRELAGDAAIVGASVSAPDGGRRFAVARHGVGFVRVHGPGDALPALEGAALTGELAECLRMAAGFVRVGVESEPTTLALEADLDDHCSTTKGCYTGQEIVARIHTYGHTNRRLCLLHLPGGEPIEEPVALHEPEDDLPVGRVMHAVPVPGHELRFGLGYLPGDFQAVGAKLTLAGTGEVVVARGVAAPKES